MSEVLVTGGAGYIGSHTVTALLKKGLRPVVIDNLSNGHREAIPPEVTFFEGDIRDGDFLRRIFAKHNFSQVIHLAALAVVEESFERSDEYFDVNYYGTLELLDCCREFSVRNFIFSSSSTIYGDANARERLTEGHALHPLNPYGKTKQLCEEEIVRREGLNYLILRYFNVAGACRELKNGPRGRGSQRILFHATQAALNNGLLKINGADYPTADGTCVRDYLHVEDVADIHVCAAEHLMKKPSGLTLNCGYGRGFSVREIVDSFKKINGVDFKVEIGPRREGDPAYLVADSSALAKTLNWSSRFENPLEAICRSAYAWGRHQNQT